MKPITVLILVTILALAVAPNVSAQTAESIWLTTNTVAYKTGETVIAVVNATSATPIQGFTFQIRYDPECLRPVNAASTIPGMNGLPLPQTAGLVDGSYASTTPQTVNGILAEVRFVTLGGCQTNLTLESAALAIRNESGFAAPLAGVTIAEKNLALNIDKEVVASQADQPLSGSILPLEPATTSTRHVSGWLIALAFVAALLFIGGMFVVFKSLRIGSTTARKVPAASQTPILQIKHGPHAGKSFALNKLPCYIGRDTLNEICLNDPHVISQHVKIFAKDNGYYLMDLGGETFVNGKAVRKSSAILKSGDVVRLGKSALFVFGS
ncbi:MAG TPA: FHA domain-containing protein [Anaerolineales bacterium]|nr:FHA domain-containing protein [Anaerolineales bacterium]